MHAHKIVNGWLSQINPNDANLVLDQYGQCQLLRENSDLITVFVPSDNSTAFLLYTHIWQLTENLSSAHYEKLLALNMMGIKTRGCNLGLDIPLRSLILSYSRDIDGTDIKMFCTLVENFFSTVVEVKKQISSLFGQQTLPKKRSAAQIKFGI